MAFSIKFNEEKNQLLKATRGISFEDVIEALRNGQLLADIVHPSQIYSRQRVYIVKIKEYAHAISYIKDVQKQEIFLKTIYPSRMLTKIYLKGVINEKNK